MAQRLGPGDFRQDLLDEAFESDGEAYEALEKDWVKVPEYREQLDVAVRYGLGGVKYINGVYMRKKPKE